MRLASWTFLIMFVTNAVLGYDDDSILEMLAEEEVIETRHRPHQQREGWRGVSSSIRGGGGGGGGGGSTSVSSATNPPHPPLVPDSIHWKEDDYDSQASSSSLGRRGRGRTAESSRHSFQPTSAVTASSSAEPRKASAVSSRLSHHLTPSVSPTNDHRHVQPKRHKTPRGRLNGSRGMVAHAVCPSQTEWKRLREARDMNNTVVEVFQPSSHSSQRKRGGGGGGGRGEGEGMRWTQWFYVVSCRNQVFQLERQCIDCCIGIDHTRYASSCEQRQSYVLAYIRRPWQRKFSWDYILINSGCNCAITSLHEDL